MGYYTLYQLKVIGGTKPAEDYFEEIGELSDYKTDEGYENGPFETNVKWYNSDDDMKEFSKRYPDVIFALYGEGELSIDKWMAYYKNGKSHDGNLRIVNDDFDESKLE